MIPTVRNAKKLIGGKMTTELTITIRDEEKRKLTKEFLIHEAFQWKADDETINRCVKELLDEFKGEPDDIKVRATMLLR
jgi:hypothetical protein